MDAFEKSQPFGGGDDVVDGHEHGRRAGTVVGSTASRQNAIGRIAGTTVGRLGGGRHDVEPTTGTTAVRRGGRRADGRRDRRRCLAEDRFFGQTETAREIRGIFRELFFGGGGN